MQSYACVPSIMLFSFRYDRFFDHAQNDKENVNITILSLRADLFGVAISR